MNIQWAGLACFKIEGETATIVADPYGPEAGLKLPKLKAHAVLASSDQPLHSAVRSVEGLEGMPRLIPGAGEYEVREALIYGIEVPPSAKRQRQVIFRLQLDGLTLVHLGAIGNSLDQAVLEHLDKTDIVFVPVGGGTSLNAEAAVQLVNQIEPRIVIPMWYKIPGIKLHLDGLESFLKELGIRPEAALPKLKIGKKDLPSEDMKVIILEPL